MLLLAVALYTASPYAIDGDTIVVNHEHIRVLQINAPEIGMCYADEAKQFTQRFMEKGGDLIIKADSNLDQSDQYGRSMRYVFKGNKNLSLELARNGYAKPMFFNGMRGKYANLIYKYARQAKAQGLGLWSCKRSING